MEAAGQVSRRSTRTGRGVSAFPHLFRFFMRDFSRSSAPIGLLIILLAADFLLFAGTPNRRELFTGLYIVTALAAIFSAAVFLSRANRHETHAIVARPISRASFFFALLFCSWLVAMIGYLLSALATIARFGGWLSTGNAETVTTPLSYFTDPSVLLSSSVTMMALSAFVVGLASLLSPLVASAEARLVALVSIALLVMSFDSRNFPIVALRPLLEQLPPVLAPIAGALKYATDAPADNVAATSLLILITYAALLWLVATWIFTTRDLTFE